jgi:GMP synthase-like glutamine amidotransferase
MSVNDEDSLPWLTAEKAFIRQAIAANKPILGICLGAQLIANACNCRVSPNPLKEIGWFPITAVAHEQPALFAFPPELTVLQWHGETFELPPQAQQLARSQACEQQAFQLIGKPVIGLQFHLETTASSLQSLMGNCAEELVVAPYIQSAESLRATPASQYRLVNEVMAKLLNYLTQWPHI